MPSTSRPLSSAQLAEHFTVAESYLRHAIETRASIEVMLTSPVPGTMEPDGWRLRLGCSSELMGARVEWVAAFAIDALITENEDDIGGESLWDDGPEVITTAVELPQVTAALATWLLREGWLGSSNGLEPCAAIECTLSFIGGELFAEQRVRGNAAPPLPGPHWVRARERREACEALGERPRMSWDEFRARYRAEPGEGENPFGAK